MKNKIAVLILLFLASHTDITAQKFSDCTTKEPIFFRSQQPAKYNGSLQEYFEKEFSGRFENFKGSIQLQILIDTNGRACCMFIDNNTSKVPSTEIKDAINKMTGWTSAMSNNHPTYFSAVIVLQLRNKIISANYINENPPVLSATINNRTSNNPQIDNNKQTKSVWKLWNFQNSMLPANLARSVAINSDGVIWYCTDNGIVRIENDDNWTVFNGMNTPALAGKNKNSWTTGLAVDKSDNIWIQSFDNIVKYDGNNWTKYDTSNSPLKQVKKISVDANGAVWFCSFNGLVKYDGKNWTKYSMTNSPIASDDVSDVYLDKNNTLWIATAKGINKLSNGKWSLISKGNSSLPANTIAAIKGDKNGNIWAGAYDSENENQQFLVKVDSSEKISSFASGVIWNITVDDSENKIWLATNGRGLVSFDGKKFTEYNHSNSIITNNTISDILIDSYGNKWVATFGGLVFISQR